jgi:Flp pilus assembly protein TadD
MRIAARQYSDDGHLAELERMLARLPASTDLQFARACCLEDLGRDEAAAQAYLAIVEREPRHLGARVNLGLMLRERGDLAGAHAQHASAAACHPLDPIARVNFGTTLAERGDLGGALREYAAALALDPAFFAAHHGMALAYEALGDTTAAEHHLARAFAMRASWTLPYRGTAPPLRVLLLVSGRGGDLVAHPFLDDRVIETTLLVPEGWRPGAALPPHDVVFNGIGDADRARGALERADALLAASPAATINAPRRVLATGRAHLAARLGALPHVVVPRTERFARAGLDAAALAAHGWTFPLLVRSPGYHAGRHFERVDDAATLAATLARLPGDDVFVIAFRDTRGADGCFRKYRVLAVDGRIAPVHLAIARDWKVHYFSSDMPHSAAHRAEERRFLDDMTDALGARAVAAVQAVANVLGLDYGGIDFGLDPAGDVVVFEANATMAVYPPEPGAQWAYRRASYDAVLAAVRAMIRARAAM